MASSLSISNANYARDKAGKEALKKDLSSQMDKVVSKLGGSNYDTMIKTIDRYWNGTDADDFKSDLKKKIEEVKSDVKKIRQYMENAIDKDYNNFVKFQSKNIK